MILRAIDQIVTERQQIPPLFLSISDKRIVSKGVGASTTHLKGVSKDRDEKVYARGQFQHVLT